MSVLSMLKIDTWTSERVVSWIKGRYNHKCNVKMLFTSVLDNFDLRQFSLIFFSDMDV